MTAEPMSPTKARALLDEHRQKACYHPDGWFCGKCHVLAPCLTHQLAAAYLEACEERDTYDELARKRWDTIGQIVAERDQARAELATAKAEIKEAARKWINGEP